MAMELVAAAMTPLIEKLGKLLASEVTLEDRVRKDVASLQRELMVMHVKLRELAEVPPERLDEGTKLRARDARELSYDMADAIEAFTLRAGEDEDPAAAGLRSRLRRFLESMPRLFRKRKALHEVADAVRDAMDLAVELGEIHQRYAGVKPQDAGAGSSGDIDPRLTAMFTEAANLVGVDGPRDKLIEVLSDRSEVGVKTVSIVGFGGLGKTTLAKAVYDKIKLQFECAAFVSVSRNPDITRILQLILFELDKQCYDNVRGVLWNTKRLIDELRSFLQDKRYLIVIDDLWDEKNWEFIKCAFPKNTCSSRLITTTRKHNISEASCTSNSDIIHEMRPLSEGDSFRLFHSRIFHQGNQCSTELEHVSSDILNKCGGVPLAIITIASLLASGKHVKTKDQWLILLNSIGRGLRGSWRVKDMHKILSLSYYDLPSHLKPCLLYLSIFPEDYEIDRERLIWRWIAEGFIQHDSSRFDSLFEIGESYFIELVNRSMIQPVNINDEGIAEACRVHDIVLDLIRSMSSKENFVTVWDTDEETTSSNNMSRRLSIHQNTNTRQATTKSMSKVRSFTIFSLAIDSMPSLSQFQVLRVLDLEDCNFSKCDNHHMNLRHVGKLSHLRYLGLRNTIIHELPDEVGNLQFLQTLDVRGSIDLQRLPEPITGLRNLMRLRLNYGTWLPKGLGNLISLEELTGVEIYGDDSVAIAKELGHLTKLKVLDLDWEAADDVCEALMQSLGNLRKLKSLYLNVFEGRRGELLRDWVPPRCLRRFWFSDDTWLESTNTLPTLPAWVKNSSSSLTFLDISVRQVSPEDLQDLGSLPSLRFVRLFRVGPHGDNEESGRLPARMTVNAGAFPCARACLFWNFVTTPSMFPPGAMPHVQELVFSVCTWDFASGGGGFRLDDLRMGHLPSLEKIVVELFYRMKEKEDNDLTGLVEKALQQAAKEHPNRVALQIIKNLNYGARRSNILRKSNPSYGWENWDYVDNQN